MTDDKKREIRIFAASIVQDAQELELATDPRPSGGQQAGPGPTLLGSLRDLERSCNVLRRLVGLAAGPDVSRVHNWPPPKLEFWAAQNDGKAVLVDVGGRWFLLSCEYAADPACSLDTPLRYIEPFELPEPICPES